MKNKIVGAIIIIAIIITSIFAGLSIFGGPSGFVASNYTMSYGAFSTASLLSTFSSQTSNNNLLGNESNNLLLANENPQLDIETLNDYYNMLAPYIENGTDDIVTYTDLSGTDPDYEVVIQAKFSLGTGQAQTMTLKYNIGEKVLEDDDEDEDYDEEFEDEEIESRFEGVLIMGANTYDFVGKSEIEDDEEKFEIKAVIDELNYVKMQTKYEEDELKYEYEISENGVITSTEVKIEDEEDKEFKIELKIKEDGIEKEYTLKTELEDGIEVTKMVYDVDGQEGKIYINKLAGLDGVFGTEDDTVEYTIQEPGELEVTVEKEIDNDFGDIEDED